MTAKTIVRRRSLGAIRLRRVLLRWLEVQVDFGPKRAAGFVDGNRIGWEAERGVAGEIKVLGVSLIEQVVDARAELEVLVQAPLSEKTPKPALLSMS